MSGPGRRIAACYTRPDSLEGTGAAAVVTANPGCILPIAAGLRERGLPMRILHVVELLDEADAAAERSRPA